MINYLAVVACGVVAMIIGGIWYGPLFGRTWMKVIGAADIDKEACKKMQKAAWPLYLVQFLLTLFQAWVLAWYIDVLGGFSGGVHTAFSIWLAFVMPTIAGASMWNNESRKIAWTRFLLQTGYQLVMFIIFGFILTVWK